MRTTGTMPIAPRASVLDENRPILRRDIRLERATPNALQIQPRSLSHLAHINWRSEPRSDLDLLALISCRSLPFGSLLPPSASDQLLRMRRSTIRPPIVPPIRSAERFLVNQFLRQPQQVTKTAASFKQSKPAHNNHAVKTKTPTSSRMQISSTDKEGEKDSDDYLILKKLGESALERRANKVPYFDASVLPDVPQAVIAKRRVRGGVSEPFPEKLYRMLIETEEKGQGDIVSFYPHGRAFGIHKPERFAKEVMPLYFNMGKVNSFQRQLNLYGFVRVSTGPDSGAYYHELLLKGRPALSMNIVRVGTPKAVPRRRGVKAQGTLIDPDFYTLPPISETLK